MPPRRSLAAALAASLALAAAALAACGADPAPAQGDGRAPIADAVGAASGDAVPIVLQDVDLTGVGHDVGRADAPLVIVEFSDFGCGYCASHARETFPVLRQEFVDSGAVLYKHVPFVMGMFPNSDAAAKAAECAADQGRFWAMHDRLFEQQRAWRGVPEARAAAVFTEAAQAVGLDASRFAACMRQPEHPRTARANAAARQLGVRATPTFSLNGAPVEGALPLPVFRRVVRDMVAQARAVQARARGS